MIPNSGEAKKKASFVLMTGKTAVRQAISERVAPISDDLHLEIRPSVRKAPTSEDALIVLYIALPWFFLLLNWFNQILNQCRLIPSRERLTMVVRSRNRAHEAYNTLYGHSHQLTRSCGVI